MSTESTTKPSAPLAFIDCETTGLNPDTHSMWELAVIRRENGTDTEHLWQIRLANWEIEQAEPKAMEINRYRERNALPDDYQVGDMTHACGLPHPMKRDELRDQLRGMLDGAVLIGSNPAFDASFLKVFLETVPWHYRTIDIATLAAGRKLGQVDMVLRTGGKQLDSDIVEFPLSSRNLSRWVGVEPPGDDVAHTALGDARWARDVFDAVTGGVA
ncbi:3'-5' exonuclease [Streptomyces olivaceus]|uniref:3'-5' exonuclease n=1 Tax=Streptomyces olivaceus TaxID=47716 RepID=UPI0036B9BFE9